MDALALLCTLHADGPTSLKRLRASGCSSIDALVAHSPQGLADALEIERAVARRLLREARLLAERVGSAAALDPEEAPPTLGRLTEQDGPPLAVAPSAPQETVLNAADRALVARLTQPESQPEAEQQPETEPLLEIESGSLEAGRLPGLDAALIDDLGRLDIRTYDELGCAESLELTRGLGITFAQARRLRFLARRAAETVSEPPPAEPVAEERTVEPTAVPTAELTAVPTAEPTEEPTEEQGIRIDPKDIEPRLTFAEQFARAAAARKAAETHTGGHTILGWNFEIPRPESDCLPFASISASGSSLGRDVQPEAGQQAPTGPIPPEDDIAGPFARA